MSEQMYLRCPRCERILREAVKHLPPDAMHDSRCPYCLDKRHKLEPVVVLPASRAAALLRLEAAVRDKDDLLKMMLQTTPPSERGFMRYAVPAICSTLLARMEAADGR